MAPTSARLLLGMLLVLCPGSAPPRASADANVDAAAADDALAAASQALESGDAEGALRILEPLLADPAFPSLDAPRRARVPFLLGHAAEAREDPESAAHAFQMALAAAKGGAESGLEEDALLGAARAALEMKDARSALAALEQLAPAALERPQAAGLRGSAFLLDGDTRGAERAFEKSLRGGPSAEALLQLGIIRFDRGEHLAALERFNEAARLGPPNYYLQVYRARSLLELDRSADAVKVLGPLAESTGSPESHYLLGKAWSRLGRFEEAAASFRKAMERNPAYAEACLGLGTALRRLGRKEEAGEALKRFEALHEEEASRLRKMNALSQALLRSPRDASAAEALARASLESGDLEAAERHAWQALRGDPTRRGARILLARALARSGRYAAAAIHYRRILEADPAEVEARVELEELVRKHARKRP